jgi:hypothetical protein
VAENRSSTYTYGSLGGKSKDDIHESRLRHEYESANSPSIKIESLDSWIKNRIENRRASQFLKNVPMGTFFKSNEDGHKLERMEREYRRKRCRRDKVI